MSFITPNTPSVSAIQRALGASQPSALQTSSSSILDNAARAFFTFVNELIDSVIGSGEQEELDKIQAHLTPQTNDTKARDLYEHIGQYHDDWTPEENIIASIERGDFNTASPLTLRGLHFSANKLVQIPENVTLERCTNERSLMTFHHGELYAFGSGHVTTKGDGTAYAIGPNARAGLVSVDGIEGKVVTLLGAHSVEIRANL